MTPQSAALYEWENAAAMLAEIQALRAERDALRQMLDVTMNITNMSDEQLRQLIANARAALKEVQR